MRRLILLVVALLLLADTAARKTVSFPTEDGGLVYADVYGEGDRDVVPAHGGQFNKESWEKQARTLAAAGFRVLAIDFRGYGKSRGPGDSDPIEAPLHLDVLAAVRYLRQMGAKTVSIVGGSMGGGAAGDAAIGSRPGEIDRVVFLGSAPNGPADKLKCPTLFICGSRRCQRGWTKSSRHSRTIRESSRTKEADHSRRLRACSISVPNRSSRSRDARDPRFSLLEVNCCRDWMGVLSRCSATNSNWRPEYCSAMRSLATGR